VSEIKYCIECGSLNIEKCINLGNPDTHKFCRDCHQEMFTDIDYTETQALILRNFKTKIKTLETGFKKLLEIVKMIENGMEYGDSAHLCNETLDSKEVQEVINER